ncbi:hypothetical protein FS837_010418 [Tulasnella sp. UAMH 9824]|nr:hypothetical protein FS837_010418 [Tulasnella sp. UAMH 9824]
MFGFSSRTSPPAAVPPTSAPPQPQPSTARSPLMRVARKLKKVFTRPRPNSTVSLKRPDEINHVQSSRFQSQTNLTSIPTSTKKHVDQPSSTDTNPAHDPVAGLQSNTPPLSPPHPAPVSLPLRSASSIPNGSNWNPMLSTPQTSAKRDIEERERARAEAYLVLTGDFRRSATAEQLTKDEIKERDLVRASSYLKLVGLHSEMKSRNVSLKGKEEFRRWGAAEQSAEQEIEDRERAHLVSYMKLAGELQ